jgi:hypothetical protein
MVLASVTKSTHELPGSSPQGKVLEQHTTDSSPSPMATFRFPSQGTESTFSAVDIDELSDSLGLPGGKKEMAANEFSAHSNQSHASQGIPNALYGKLIDRALSKPVTASALAHYMKSRSESSEDTIKATQESHNSFSTLDTSNQEQRRAMKVVCPPPGFEQQMPRIVTVQNVHTATGPAAMQQNIAPTAPPGYFQQYPNTVQSTTSLQHHSRHSHSRRRPRVHTRTKRTDQGPEPSAADIYPDDANWTPAQYSQQKYFTPPSYIAPPPQPIVRVEDALSWPTPAEVYQHEPQPPAPAHVPQTFDIFEAHATPTADDMGTADAEVFSLIGELPAPTIQTLMYFGAFDLLPEDRPLSPDQQSGKRYGVNYYGIGIGDDWTPPPAHESDPFRVRPRDHQGWADGSGLLRRVGLMLDGCHSAQPGVNGERVER